ncbi:hypothetical protein ACFPIK_17815 [Algoriphagus aquatilis]|uniref:Uncharacterized protein n=1 Tax=Algoriphagus aquatilis TaxID=490186 RepID=A0ABW0C1Z4_9BACT
MLQNLVYKLQTSLKTYSVGLSKQRYLIEKPWTIVDGNLNVHRLVFKKKGVLRAFRNGNMEDNCSWDYEQSLNSLVIKIGNEEGVLLNEVFLDGKVLILKKDNTNEFWIFINSDLLEGHQLEEYLKGINSGKPVNQEPDNDNDLWLVLGVIVAVFFFILLLAGALD